MAKQQPVATDLRRVTSIMRLISDIERIADHCSDISENLLEINEDSPVTGPGKTLRYAGRSQRNGERYH